MRCNAWICQIKPYFYLNSELNIIRSVALLLHIATVSPAPDPLTHPGLLQNNKSRFSVKPDYYIHSLRK